MDPTFSETADSIGEKVQQRLDKLVGLKFVFRVRCNSDEAAEIVETLQEFSTLPSNDPASTDPWFCWKVFHRKNTTEWELSTFRVYDGKNLYSFNRIDPLAPENFSQSGFIKDSGGHIEPCAHAVHAPTMSECQFSWFLFMNLVGCGKTIMDESLNKHSPFPWQIVDSSVSDKFVLERLIKFPTWEKGYSIRVHVAMTPEPMVMRSGNQHGSYPTDLDNFSEVLEIAPFEDLFYPSKGRSFDPACDRIKHDRVYEYEVESVSRVSERERTTWVPDWPAGTCVFTFPDGYRRIAHTRETQIRDFCFRMVHDRPKMKEMKIKWPIRVLVEAVGIGLKISLPFFRFAAKRNALKKGWIIKHKKISTKGTV